MMETDSCKIVMTNDRVIGMNTRDLSSEVRDRSRAGELQLEEVAVQSISQSGMRVGSGNTSSVMPLDDASRDVLEAAGIDRGHKALAYFVRSEECGYLHGAAQLAAVQIYDGNIKPK